MGPCWMACNHSTCPKSGKSWIWELAMPTMNNPKLAKDEIHAFLCERKLTMVVNPPTGSTKKRAKECPKWCNHSICAAPRLMIPTRGRATVMIGKRVQSKTHKSDAKLETWRNLANVRNLEGREEIAGFPFTPSLLVVPVVEENNTDLVKTGLAAVFFAFLDRVEMTGDGKAWTWKQEYINSAQTVRKKAAECQVERFSEAVMVLAHFCLVEISFTQVQAEWRGRILMLIVSCPGNENGELCLHQDWVLEVLRKSTCHCDKECQSAVEEDDDSWFAPHMPQHAVRSP